MALLLLGISLLIISSTATHPRDDFLHAHNRARAQVGVPALVWDDTIATYAANYAYKRSSDCRLEHSRGPYGENLAEGWGQLTATDAVEMWVGEKTCYDYDSNSCMGGQCLHYTQVVWNETKWVGCGTVWCQNGWVFIVCDYDPPGNYFGQRPY